MASKQLIVDIHTHVYPPSYITLLQSRTQIPYVRTFPPSTSLRLVILPSEDTGSTTRGRPVGPDYYDITQKIKFMDTHNISISVISLANPWLDFLSAEEAGQAATAINDEVNEICGRYPGRLFAFGTLPLSASVSIIEAEIERLSGLKYMRGIILGTTGLGKGLDDPALIPIFAALAKANFPIFLHPHYGLPTEVYGNSDYGHVLPLALGFPMETTIAITRLILSGLFSLPSCSDLQIILAHSGGTLPFLAGRIESCIEHDSHLKEAGKLEGRKTVWEILKKNIYLDAVIYGDVGVKAAVEASGRDRVMFGTDHPFFPPLERSDGGEGEWMSVTTNVKGIRDALGKSKQADLVLGGNAMRVLRLDVDK